MQTQPDTLLDDLRQKAEQIADALQANAEDRNSPRSFRYRLARGHALMLVDLLEEISESPC